MARFALPVMNTRLLAPADNASSAAYWISGLSTIGSISLGLALVAGRKRVPRPATGKTAARMGLECAMTLSLGDQCAAHDTRWSITTTRWHALEPGRVPAGASRNTSRGYAI